MDSTISSEITRRIDRSTPKAILFDAGNTLIVETPGMNGPMVTWAVLELVPGIPHSLEALQGKYLLGVATNANQSRTADIFAALHRLNIEQYFSKVYCARDMGSRKPEPAYFAAILNDLHLPAHHVLMVGDIYEIDVLGAKRASLKAIWYNPEHLLVDDLQPACDAEIDSMDKLPAVLSGGFLPDIPACKLMLESQEGNPGLWEHVTAVAKAAYKMAAGLRLRGIPVDPLLAHRGGLLHDLDKVTSRQHNRIHGQLAAEMLYELGYKQLGEIARRHLIDTVQAGMNGPRTWEEKLVFYADKIVEGSRLVPLPVRLDALRHRYPAFSDRITACQPLVENLEKEICSALGVTPGGLLSSLHEA